MTKTYDEVQVKINEQINQLVNNAAIGYETDVINILNMVTHAIVETAIEVGKLKAIKQMSEAEAFHGNK